MLLSYNQLMELLKQGVVSATPDQVNASSIDVRLGPVLMVERTPAVVDLAAGGAPALEPLEIPADGYPLRPGEFVLGATQEVFDLPDTLSAEYMLKSSLARCGLEHMAAGWCDAGWNNAVLTLELLNVTRRQTLVLTAGMPIGQIKFFAHEQVPAWASYRTRGQYNCDRGVTGSKGVK